MGSPGIYWEPRGRGRRHRGEGNQDVSDAIERTLKKPARNYVTGHFVEDGAAALELIKPHLQAEVTVAGRNSLTLRQTGIFPYPASGEHPARLINQFEPGLPFEENQRLKKSGLLVPLQRQRADREWQDLLYYVTINGQLERNKDCITVIIVDQELGL